MSYVYVYIRDIRYRQSAIRFAAVTVTSLVCADCEVIDSEDETEEVNAHYRNSGVAVTKLPIRCFYCSQQFQYR